MERQEPVSPVGPVWVEVHVDDEVLAADPARWPEARALVWELAGRAERQGATLCFRFRETFAGLARGDGVLPALVERGHELGVHAHGRGFAAAARAVRECGVNPPVAVPGLVQAGPEGRGLLLGQVRDLGFERVTDHGPHRAWAYEGLLPRVEQGVLVLAPTVRPFDWGLMTREGKRSVLSASMVRRLRSRETAAFEQGARYFGVALHEHDLCPPGSLEPLSSSLDAFEAYLDSRVGSVMRVSVPESTMGAGPTDHEQGVAHRSARRPMSDRHLRVARVVRASTRPLRDAGRALLGSASPGESPGAPVPGGNDMVLRVGGSTLSVRWETPPDPSAVVVVSHSGRRGGRVVGLEPFGLAIRTLLGRGWAVLSYDRSGTGASPERLETARAVGPGSRVHREDWEAVLAHARRYGLPVVALTWSAGLLPVLQAAAQGRRPDAVVDAEAPADRWSLLPPEEAFRQGRAPEQARALQQWDPWQDSLWSELEAVRLLASLQAPYARLQAVDDHVHGTMHEHAARMVSAARETGQPVWFDPELPGRLHGHPLKVLEALDWAVRAVRRSQGTSGLDAC